MITEPKAKIYKMPEFDFTVFEKFKPDPIWENFSFSSKNQLKVKSLIEKMKNRINKMSKEEQNQLIRPPEKTFDPEVTQGEFNDFLAVVYGIKPASIIGQKHKGKTYNPIAKFIKANKDIFSEIKLANYWDFATNKNYKTCFTPYQDGFIYNPKLLQKVLNDNKDKFSDWTLTNLQQKLYDLQKISQKNPREFHTKLGLLLGYSKKAIKKFIKNMNSLYR